MQTPPFRYASELYDDLWLPEETVQVRETVRAFAEQHVRPVAHELNNTPESVAAFPRELVGEMAALRGGVWRRGTAVPDAGHHGHA